MGDVIPLVPPRAPAEPLVILKRSVRPGWFRVRTDGLDPPSDREFPTYYQANCHCLRLMQQHECRCLDYVNAELAK